MPIKVSAAVAILMVNAAADAADAGAAAGKLSIYGGAQPANPDTAVSGQPLLVEFDLGDEAFGDGVDGGSGATATGNPVDPVPATATGTATWFRITDSNGGAVIDGDVTDTAGSGALKVSSTSIIEDIDVSIVSMTFTMPKA